MKKLLIIIIIFSAWVQTSKAQLKKKTVYSVEIGSLIGISTNSYVNDKFNAFRVKLLVSRFVNENISLGISLGTDNYRKKGSGSFNTFYNTLPLDISGAYFFGHNYKGLFSNASIGYAPKLFSNFEKGLNLGIGLGNAFSLSENTSLYIKTGYNYQKINQVQFYNSTYSNLNLSSIILTAGINF